MANLKLRRGQSLTTFGPGSLVDFEGIGFYVCDIGHWPLPKKIIEMERLRTALGCRELRGFPDEGEDGGISVGLFPAWFHCPNCKALRKVKFDEARELAGSAPPCHKNACRRAMIPMRFVAYCDNGHLGEIDWSRWAHSEGNEVDGTCGSSGELEYHAGGQGGGDFTSMFVKCRACGRSRNFADLVNKPINRAFVGASGQNCCGRQPRLKYGAEPEPCDQQMKVEPRGSTSIYRAKTISALDIEKPEELAWDSAPEFNGIELAAGRRCLEAMRTSIPAPSNRERAIQAFFSNPSNAGSFLPALSDFLNSGVSKPRVLEILQHLVEEEKSLATASPVSTSSSTEKLTSDQIQEKIRDEESAIFRAGEDINTKNLVIEFSSLNDTYTARSRSLISKIARVRRLREVQVFTGFTRGKGLNVQPDNLFADGPWKYANEGFGEGVYVELNQTSIKQYLSDYDSDINRLTESQIRQIKKHQDDGGLELPQTPLFMITHTLSHFLIRQLTFEAGYSSSALRERIYLDAGADFAGILIYTTESDAEGTLGGLVDVAIPEKLNAVIEAVFDSAAWCSADPVCRETERQGIGGLNHSSCHCCTLIAETSCNYQNAGLNRMLLCGRGDGAEDLGFLTMIEKYNVSRTNDAS